MQTQDGLDSGELPEGTGEFLDTWLFLLERLVNPRTMLDSPHSLPAKSSQPGYQPFSPLKFLIHIQKVRLRMCLVVIEFMHVFRWISWSRTIQSFSQSVILSHLSHSFFLSLLEIIIFTFAKR